tara:strand:- start:1506 stop:1835 length:330 start_codon:yes stop_codon:yes gene_type:complete
MAFTAYHNINGANGVNQTLLDPGDDANNIKSILFTNIDNETVTVSLFIQDDPSSGSTSTFYILKTVDIPQSTSLLLDNPKMLAFNNGSNGYGLYITVGSGHTVDVLITK